VSLPLMGPLCLRLPANSEGWKAWSCDQIFFQLQGQRLPLADRSDPWLPLKEHGSGHSDNFWDSVDSWQ
jgi:hypothetical protein